MFEVDCVFKGDMSVVWCTMRTPNALMPCGDMNVWVSVAVTPFLDVVTVTTLPVHFALNVQKWSTQGAESTALEGTQDREMSLRYIGQQVTVVIVLTPLESEQALQYPLGQAMPGEKKEVDSVSNPGGRQVGSLSITQIFLGMYMPLQAGGLEYVVVSG